MTLAAQNLAFAIVGNLAGDYTLQNDWMANNKKKVSWICAVHCAIWTASVVTMAGPSWLVWWVPFVLFLTHFAQDRTNLVLWYMKKNGQAGFATNLGPWSIIAVDNVLHIVTLATVARLI